MAGITSVDRVSATDPKSALALQRLVQAAVSITFISETCVSVTDFLWQISLSLSLSLSVSSQISFPSNFLSFCFYFRK